MALMPLFSPWLFGSSWQVVAVSLPPPGRLSSDIWLRDLRLDLLPKSELGKNGHYGGMNEVALPELVGEGRCGAGIMLFTSCYYPKGSRLTE